jgi:hypothetical protein
LLDKSLPTTSKDWTQLKKPASDKNTCFFGLFSEKEKKFYHIGYWCQWGKLFFFVKDVRTE